MVDFEDFSFFICEFERFEKNLGNGDFKTKLLFYLFSLCMILTVKDYPL